MQIRLAGSIVIICALAGAAPASAQEAAAPLVTLPLDAPEGTAAPLADFVAVCSRSLQNLSTGITAAQQRGWRMEGEGGMSAMMAALMGFATLSKDIEGTDHAMLNLTRVVYPHVVASNCMMNLVGSDPAQIDSAPLDEIPGMEGGLAVISGTNVGRWSGVDSDGDVVAITDTPAGERFRVLSMSRGVLTAHGEAAKAAAAARR